MINAQKSQKIYADLINGRIINKMLLAQEQLQPNPDYTELFSNLDAYVEMYRNIGFELVFRDNFFFIRDLDLGDTYKEMAIKIQVSLLILSRKITEEGFGYDLLENEAAGISMEQMEKYSQLQDVQGLISAAKLAKKTLSEVVKDILVEKRIMMINSRKRYVLTDAGKYFFQQLFSSSETTNN